MLNLQMWLQVQFKFHDCICIVVNSLCRQNRLLKSVKVNITNVNFYAFAYCDVIAEEEDRRLSFLQHEQSGKQSRAGLKSTWAEQSGKRGVLDFSGTWPEYTPWGGVHWAGTEQRMGVTEIGRSTERRLGHSCSAHMLCQWQPWNDCLYYVSLNLGLTVKFLNWVW